MTYQDINNLDESIQENDPEHVEHHIALAKQLKFLAGEVQSIEPNVELAYAQLTNQVALPAEWTDIDGLSITFATTNRPAMVTVYLGIVQGSGPAGFAGTYLFEAFRQSDNVGVTNTVATVTEAAPFQPIPMLQFRVPAGKASDTYKVRVSRFSGNTNGTLNFTEKTVFISAGQV